ncbi:hypothetical protein [Candidatus Stoquefichus massiliensis]|uniref:hypothetical protein n=1 Tax=Candidatus Stoquefichus massiliensis TaxID=1470350 RepID=UPI000482976B|nr:hypothetical protein [Candidatus Stoquefichus massiliensis]
MKKVLIQILVILLYAIGGGICGYFGISFLDSSDHFILPLLFILFSFYISIFLQTIIHELGHMIFGLLSGYQFISIRFFNFTFIKEDEKLKVKSMKIPGTMGQCLMTIDHFQEPFPFVLYHLGGIFSNLITAMITLILCFVINQPYVQTFFMSLSVFGIISAITNAIPFIAELDNDGTNVYNMIKYPITKYACFQQLKIVESINLGYSLKDTPEDYFTIYSHQDLKYSLCMSITVLACLRQIDLGHYQKAYDLAEDILSHVFHINDNYRFILKGTMIYNMLLNDPQDSRIEIMRDKKYMKLSKLLSSDLTNLRVEYAYELLHNHNPIKATQILDKFNKITKTYPFEGEVIFEQNQINHIKEKNDNETE